MIFGDTKVQVVSFLKAGHRTAFLLSLSREGVKEVDWFERGLEYRIAEEHPVVVIRLFQDMSQKQAESKSPFKPNHAEVIDVFLERPSSLMKKAGYSIHWTGSGKEIAQAISHCEQRIIQRLPFHSKEVDEEFYIQLNLLGKSRAYAKAMKSIKKVASNNSSVFIRGESGTGKELVARAIHYISDRRGQPFVPINCGAFTDELILSELFGHQRGAFTGASTDRVGLLETANGGTLFLDEVDALSPKAQVSLLRYLQEGEIRPIGSNKVKNVEVRVISATNKDTQELVEKDLLRQDLMYRLDILNVTMPPLRRRGEDIHLLAQYYLAQLAMEESHPGKYLSNEIIEELSNYAWPGNVRELETTIRRAFLMTDADYISDIGHLFPNHNFDEETEVVDEELQSFAIEKAKLIQQFEKEYLHKLLEETGGNISRAATIAKKERRAFSRLMQKHGLDRKTYV